MSGLKWYDLLVLEGIRPIISEYKSGKVKTLLNYSDT